MFLQFLVILISLPRALPQMSCTQNSDCKSLCCLQKIYLPFAIGKCENKLMLRDFCLPNQKSFKIVGKELYVKSCPCKSGFQCNPQYVKYKDQTVVIVNPRCGFPPLESTTPSPSTSATTTISTTPCVSKQPLIVNLSISIPLP